MHVPDVSDLLFLLVCCAAGVAELDTSPPPGEREDNTW